MSRSQKRQRTEVLLGIRCYPEEKKQIQEKAEVASLSVSKFLLRCVLSRRITPRTDIKLIAELSKLGGL